MTWRHAILSIAPIRLVGHPRPASASEVDCMTKPQKKHKSDIYYRPITCISFGNPSDRGTTHYWLGCDSTPHHYCTNQGNENMLTHKATSEPKLEVPPTGTIHLIRTVIVAPRLLPHRTHRVFVPNGAK
ncbi:hypothetical protein AVEN_231132-1 [Araneus ventricosus]|uniref:Uncharacterized protein n=1 Tax=Araneus ventricosus TaxID=182803 RepID=A0A4Y2TDW3_ARAVE|nr:hypothetical protein AVEN_231132-1 [Araneus ventricosus]